MSNLDNIFRELPPKYRELQYFRKEQLNTTDVAQLMIKLDEQVFQNLVAFATASTGNSVVYKLYLPNLNSGIWEEQCGKDALIETINDVRRRIKLRVMNPLEISIYELKGKTNEEDVIAETKKKYLLEAKKLFTDLIFKLGTETFKNGVINGIITSAVTRTKENGLIQSVFNSKKGCIGFLDGVYDFNTKKFYKGGEAQMFYVSKTVEYEYENVLTIDDDTYNECIKFLKQIHPSDDIRDYVLKKLSNSLRGVQEQCILIHYNISGSNGKTTLFSLVKKAFGSYFMKCNIALLYPSSFNNPSSSNEELMSLQGILCALLSEPSTKQKLCASMIKELSGGDEQSTRKNYGSKQTFVFHGLAHILCNKIPEVDEYDGGIARRMKCIPYKSTFVNSDSPVDESKHRYKLVFNIEDNFDRWRYVFMKLLIDYADKVVDIPEDVSEHTKKYLDRENVVKKFLDSKVEKTCNERDHIKQTDLYTEYVMFCKSEGIAPMKKDMAYDDFHNNLDEDMFRVKSNHYRNIWRCYRIKAEECEINSDSDEGTF
jgi:P4 family phage/plasmid primase-like protien